MSIIHQAPNLVEGVGGGFEQGLIRIEAVAPSWYNDIVDGDLEQDIPQPAGIVANDDLFVILFGPGINIHPVNSGDWTLIRDEVSTLRLWRRKADGTAADQFTMTAHSANRTAAFMVRIRHQIEFLDTPAIFQGGSSNTGTGNDWEIGFPPGTAMALNTTNDPDAFVLFIAGRFGDTVSGGTVNPVEAESMETIAQITIFDGTAGVDTSWILFKFKYTNPGIAYSAGELGYTPDPTNGNFQRAIHQRLAYFP